MASLSRTAHERTKEPSDACEQTPVLFRHVCSSGRDGREQRHTGVFQPERPVFIAERNPAACWRKESLLFGLSFYAPGTARFRAATMGGKGKDIRKIPSPGPVTSPRSSLS